MIRGRTAAALVGAMVAALLAGCSSQGTDASGRSFYSGDIARAEASLEAQLASDEDGRALCLDELGVIALCRGDLDLAYRRFLEASQIMGAFTGTGLKEVGAIVGSEATKIWRGDPHEKLMNSYYLGVVNLLRGVDDNALAGFKNSIVVDSGQGDEKYDADFAPSWFLEGVAYSRLDDIALATRSLETSRKFAPDCAACATPTASGLIVLLDVGRGPTKYGSGQHGEATRFREHPAGCGPIDVVVDGNSVGSAQKAGDLFFQAKTRGGRDYDAVLAGKSAYKTGAHAIGTAAVITANDLPKKYQGAALLGGIGLLLTSIAVDARADVRHWTTLPAEVQLFRAELAPGTHSVTVVPPAGWKLAGPPLAPIVVPEHGNVLVYQRIIR